MIVVHRLTHPDQPVYLNPDLIQTVESRPDTVVSTTNALKLIVSETPEEVAHLVLVWKASVVAEAFVQQDLVETGASAPGGAEAPAAPDRVMRTG